MVNNPRWSPDGTWIAFECRPKGQSDICLISPSHPTQIHVLNQWTSNEIFPSWSGDGKNVYFTSNHSGQWEIYRQSISGGDPIAITHDGGMRALPSLDGRWLYIFRDEGSGELARIPTSDQSNHPGQAEKAVTIFSRFGPDMLGKWDVDQDGFVYLKPSTNELSNIDEEKIISINGDTMTSQDVGIVAGRLPAGDLIFSTAANGKSFVYVKQGLKEGDIGFLVESAQR
jgi:Tol biopolymer transport system component